jgi:hypothetical protein
MRARPLSLPPIAPCFLKNSRASAGSFFFGTEVS